MSEINQNQIFGNSKDNSVYQLTQQLEDLSFNENDDSIDINFEDDRIVYIKNNQIINVVYNQSLDKKPIVYDVEFSDDEDITIKQKIISSKRSTKGIIIPQNISSYGEDPIEGKWRELEEFPGYKIFESGKIKMKGNKGFCKASPTDEGYIRIHIKDKHGNSPTMLAHRLVAFAFLPNPTNLPEVDHKDKKRSNNNVLNLRWVTSIENSANRDLSKVDYSKHCKPIRMYNLNNELVKIWEKSTSIIEYYRSNGTPYTPKLMTEAIDNGTIYLSHYWKIDNIDIEGEEFRDLTYKGCTFKVSNKGRMLRSNGMKTYGHENLDGYFDFHILQNDHFAVHRMVILAFGPPITLEQFDSVDLTVNHKNLKRYDNYIENLEYSTQSKNIQHGNDNNSNRKQTYYTIPVYQYSIDKKVLIARFESATEAEAKTTISNSCIGSCCSGTRLSAGSCFWSYEPLNDPSIIYNPNFEYKVRKFVNGGIPVYQFTMEKKFIREYASASEAASENKEFKFDSSTISKVCRGIKNSSKGFYWCYEEKYLELMSKFPNI